MTYSFFCGMCGIIPMCDIIECALCTKKRNRRVLTDFLFLLSGFESVYKPSSVVYGHLSRLTVTDKLKRYSRRSVGRTALLTDAQSCSKWGLHCIPCYQGIGELLPRLSILTASRQFSKENIQGLRQAARGGLFLLHFP